MRIMAIDYGDAHTGVAVSDPTGLLAGTTLTIHSRKAEVVLEELKKLTREYQVDEGGGGHRPQARAVGRAAHHHRRPPHPL